MDNPFEVLGLKITADAQEVRSAYRTLVRTCHPDRFLDADERKAAQEKMIALNLAYEEALRVASSRRENSYTKELSCEEAKQLARKMLRQHGPESGLRQLMRAERKDAEWYELQGAILMQMHQYDSAHQSYREAVRRDPDNLEYRRGALEAAVALKKSKTIPGRLKEMFRKK
ncbi:MAG: DnaJ domain-containing protein [Aristaeellaceae bacterium]